MRKIIGASLGFLLCASVEVDARRPPRAHGGALAVLDSPRSVRVPRREEGLRAPTAIWKGNVGPGWSALTRVDDDGVTPHLIVYNQATGAERVLALTAAGPRVLSSATWAAGATKMTRLWDLGTAWSAGQSTVLSYNQQTGDSSIQTLDGGAWTTIWSGSLPSGFTHFAPTPMPASTVGPWGLVAYNQASGESEIDYYQRGAKVHAGKHSFQADWSQVVYRDFEEPLYLLYSAESGKVKYVDRGFATVATDTLPAGWDAIAPASFGSVEGLLLYRSDGEARLVSELFDSNETPSGFRTEWSGKLGPRHTSLVTFCERAAGLDAWMPRALGYDAATGAATIYELGPAVIAPDEVTNPCSY
jgi:hypothetical protein